VLRDLVGLQIKTARRGEKVTKKEIEHILKNYHWMMNSIKLERESLKIDVGGNLSAQYGIEASMPKAHGQNSDPVFQEVIRRGKRWKKIERYEKEIKVIQDRIDKIKDERESEVLYWLLEGKSYRWIGQHMGFSSSHIKRLRDSIVNQLAESNGTNGTKDTNFKSHKSAC
jgi:hypothetical protein